MFNPFRKSTAPITVGIQLSTSYISLLVLDCQNADKPEIMDYVNYPVEKGSDVEQLKSNIKSYLNEKNLKNAHCCLVLDDQDYQLLVVEPPKVPKEEIAEAVKWKIKDLIQFPVNEAIVDVFAMPASNDVGSELVNVVVAHKEVVDKKAHFIQEIDLHLVAIDIPEFSYRNYFERTEYKEQNIALVLVKESFGQLIVINKGDVCFSRSFCVNYNGGLFDDIPENEIVLELQRSLDYYERQMRQVMPTQVVFIGENIIDDKVTEITTESFSQKVHVASVEGFAFMEEDSLATARVMASYGASLRHDLLGKDSARGHV